MGIPTAPMVTARFAEYVSMNNQAHGVTLRFSHPPHPVGFMPREILRQYVEGNNPVSGKPLMQELIDALTAPLTEEEKNPVLAKRPKHPRLLPADTEENLNRFFLENAWTDGLPIVLPTEERVAEMLTGTDHDPQEVVGRMSVTTHEEKLEYTVEKVAVIAVMAGARPEHFPVILALAASQNPSMPSSTTSFASMIVVNGPVRNAIGMNYSSGALSPFNYANSVIGRAWTLMSINFGDAKIAENFTASLGNTVNYNNMCCAENEELSVWEPFHVQKGFKAGESTVSLFRGWSVIGGAGDGSISLLIEAMKGVGGMGGITIVIDPLAAKSMKNEGFTTKEKLSQYLIKEVMKSTPAQPEGPRPRMIMEPVVNIVVVGGEWNPFFITTNFHYSQTESIDKWIPKSGIRYDARPLRMPSPTACKDGLCGLPGNLLSETK
jgi:hypothetical protein